MQDGENVYSAEIKEDLEDILHHWLDKPTLKKNRWDIALHAAPPAVEDRDTRSSVLETAFVSALSSHVF